MLSVLVLMDVLFVWLRCVVVDVVFGVLNSLYVVLYFIKKYLLFNWNVSFLLFLL